MIDAMPRSLFQWADDKDRERLTGQLGAVLQYLKTHERVTLRELADFSGGSEAGCSARIRDLRNEFGFDIRKERVAPGSGLYHYWLHKDAGAA